MNRTYIRESILNLLLALVGCVVAGTLLEIGTRLLPTPYPNVESGLICSNQLGWQGKPNYKSTFATDGYEHQVIHNRAGMHDQERSLAKPANTFRILMLGDSFVRAAHVKESETSHQILENLLNETDSINSFEVISGGTSGWGTGQELLYYRKQGRLYHPDIVLLMFYLGNDFNDNLAGKALTLEGKNCYAPYFSLCHGQLDTVSWLYAPGIKPVGQCYDESQTIHNLLGQIYQSSQLYTRLEPLLARHVQPDKLDYYHFYLPPKNETIEYAWQLTFALISQLQQEIKADGAELAVVLITPADVIAFSQMDVSQRESLYQKIPDLRQIQQPDFPNQRLRQTLAGKGIKVLDLLPLFSQHMAETKKPLYFPEDKHWNGDGNRFAGELIYRWLRDNYKLYDK